MMNEKLLPAAWRMVSIGDVCSHPQYGYTTKASREGNIKLLRTTDITSGKIDWESVPFCSTNPDELSKYLLSGGDIVVSRAGSIGVSYLIESPDESVFASYLIRFKPYINKKYFCYFLNSPFYWHEISENKSGIAVQNVNAQKLRAIPLAVAPEDEQHRIVAKIEELFSEIDKGVENLQTAKAQLQVYRQALLKHAFEGKLTAQWRSQHPDKVVPAEQLLEQIKQAREERYQQQLDDWKVAIEKWEFGGKEGKKPSKPRKANQLDDIQTDIFDKLPKLPNSWCWARPEELCSAEPYSIGIGPFGSNLKVSDYRSVGVPLIFVKNITRLDFSLDLKYVEKEKFLKLKAHSVEPLDILITKMGDPPGDCAIYPKDLPVAILTSDCLKFRVWDQFLVRQFFAYCIESNGVKVQLGAITKGVAQKKISVDRFKGVLFPVSPFEEQKEITLQLDSAFSVFLALEKDIDQGLVRAESLRQSILKKAFSGQLVPQDPNDEPASQLLERIKAEKIEQQSRAKAAKKSRQASKKSPSVPL